MNKEEILSYINTLPDACYDQPFEGDFFSTVLRVKASKKWFGIILTASENYFKLNHIAVPTDRTVLDLKCPPDLTEFLRAQFPCGILPAYHMNKKLWISVVINLNVPKDDVIKLINLSFDLVKESK